MTFGEKLKQIRNALNLSQDDLARILGTSKQVISRYERGERIPKLTTAQAYAKKLNVHLEDLIDGSVPPKDAALCAGAPDSIDEAQEKLQKILSKDPPGQIALTARRLGATDVVLYGSRARNDHREHSDVDLAVWGLDAPAQSRFMDMIDELPTLLDFDVVFVTKHTDPALLANIKKDGIVIMDKFAEKYEKLEKAVVRLEEALAEYAKTQSAVVRDGAIQRFEFCTELAWKTMREHLLNEGYTELNSPKAVMKQAYAAGVLRDDNAWLSLLNDRNVTSHIYDDAMAQAIFTRMRDSYIDLFRALVDALKQQTGSED
ncbi:MAG: HI0074 family nucleotidyltransferase substrate-binding subunit [Eubacteriales bacterium]|nr:HI0074 family nucleotidyltransferase substrate-binding subunit [Eubacteriales bacterium]